MNSVEIRLPDGRLLEVHDSGGGDAGIVVWHHGTLRAGAPPAPFHRAVAGAGLRWLSVSRPGHGRSTIAPGRSIAGIAADVAVVVERLGVERFSTVGHSAGASYALACAALLPERVVSAVAIAGFAPRDPPDLDWYAGLDPVAGLFFRAAEKGRDHKLQFDRDHTNLHWLFPPADREVLAPESGWFDGIDGTAGDAAVEARADDHIAMVSPWGFDLGTIACPTVLLHGEADLFVPATHARWLGATVPSARPWISPDDAHFTILRRSGAVVEWTARHLAGTVPA